LDDGDYDLCFKLIQEEQSSRLTVDEINDLSSCVEDAKKQENHNGNKLNEIAKILNELKIKSKEDNKINKENIQSQSNEENVSPSASNQNSPVKNP